ESLPWQSLRNVQSVLFPTFLANYRSILAMVSSNKDVMLVYSPRGSSFRLKLQALEAEAVHAYWFDPVDGTIQDAGQYNSHKTVRFKPQGKRRGKDAVLVVLDSNQATAWVGQAKLN